MTNGVPDEVRVESNFAYPANFLLLAPGTNQTVGINVDSSADFLWIKGAYFADNAGAAQTDATRIVPNVDCQIQLGGSDKNMFQAPVPVASVFGTGQEPSVLAMPQRLYKQSVLTITLFSREAALTLNIRLAFIGWKDYGFVRRA
jgi:hypothetical protein